MDLRTYKKTNYVNSTFFYFLFFIYLVDEINTKQQINTIITNVYI